MDGRLFNMNEGFMKRKNNKLVVESIHPLKQQIIEIFELKSDTKNFYVTKSPV